LLRFSCIIVDDDEIDRLTVYSYAKKIESLNIIGVFENSEEAMLFIAKNDVDVMFLDIDMPNINGLELRRHANKVPVCIFITSHAEHAVESFELNTLDFIVKPIKLNRFNQTISRIEKFFEVKQKADLFEASFGNDTVFIKEGHEQTKVKLHEVLYLEALKDYTLIVTNNKRHCVLSNIGNLLKENHFKSFIRIHRSFAVQKQYIEKISTSDIILNNGTLLPLGRSFKDNIQSILT
jgi:two-component system LytT family response regulator